MPKIVAAFVRAEMLETGTEERPERLAAATACGGVGALIQRGGRAVAGMLTIATAGGS